VCCSGQDDFAPADDHAGSTGELCSRHQRQAIRSLLLKAGRTEQWLLSKLQLRRLDELPAGRAEQVIHRLGELVRERQVCQLCIKGCSFRWGDEEHCADGED
jgi:hypothetical protein